MAKYVSHTHTGTVGAPLEPVFALLTTPSRIPEWLPGCSAIAPKDGEMKVGARFHLEMGSHNIRVEIEILDYNPTKTFGWVEHRRRSGQKTFVKLDYQGGATQVTLRYVWIALGFTAWIMGQFYRRRDAHRIFNGTIQNLRKALTK
jgi:uncharacterized protein YndB with AHSA1/START domain